MKPTTVDECINSFSGEQKAKLVELREIINASLPEAHEELKWSQPASVADNGMILVIFSGHKNYMSLST